MTKRQTTVLAAQELPIMVAIEAIANEMKESYGDDAEGSLLDFYGEAYMENLSEAGYSVLDLTPEKAEIEEAAPFRKCNSCELPIARKLGADIEVIGLVQKVSNLILNINFQVRDVATGKVLRAGSADIRSNTDDSWMRGVSYLVRNRLLDPPMTGKAASGTAASGAAASGTATP